MKKSWWIMLLLWVPILLSGCRNNKWNVLDWPWMINELSNNYSVDTQMRWDNIWEDIFVYDNDGNLIFSLVNGEPQYLVDLFDNYLVIDSWTSASQRSMIVYNVETKNKIFETDYYPWEEWLVIWEWNIEYYKKVNESEFASLPECENEYDNWYVERYWYDIWLDMDADLWDVRCAYFE